MKFEFSGPLLRFADYEREVSVAAATLGEAIAIVSQAHPKLRSTLLDNRGEIRRSHRLFLNNELVPRPSASMPPSEPDRVEFLTSIAGG